MINIRMLTDSETSLVQSIWTTCFPEDSPAFIDWYFKNRYRPEQTLGLFDDHDLLANLQMVPQKIVLRGNVLPAHMIVGAATLPKAQRNGYMQMLLHAAFEQCHTNTPISILYPFRYSFYRRMGYATVSDRIIATIPSVQILPQTVDYQAIHENDDLHLYEIDQIFANRFASHLIHAPYQITWQNQEFSLENAIGLKDEKNTWYAWYIIKENQCQVIALAYVSLQALHEALYALKIDSQQEQVQLALPRQDAPFEWLSDPRQLLSYEPFLMLRILDIPAVLLGMHCVTQADIVITIEDNFFQNTNQTWRIVATNGRIQLVEKSTLPSDITLSIIDFTRWITGQCSYNDLVFEGIQHAEKLNFFSPQSSYFYDMY